LKFKALEDFALLLKSSASNRAMFLQQPHWQNWFLGLLASIQVLPLLFSTNIELSHKQTPMGDGDSNAIFTLVVNIFTQVDIYFMKD